MSPVKAALATAGVVAGLGLFVAMAVYSPLFAALIPATVGAAALTFAIYLFFRA